MNAVSKLINNRRKLVRDAACLAAEADYSSCTTVAKAIFVIVYLYVAGEQQAYSQIRPNRRK